MAYHSHPQRGLFGPYVLALLITLPVTGPIFFVFPFRPPELVQQTCQRSRHITAAHGLQVSRMEDLLAHVWLKGDKERVVWDGAKDMEDKTVILSEAQSEAVHEDNRTWTGTRVPGSWYAEDITESS